MLRSSTLMSDAPSIYLDFALRDQQPAADYTGRACFRSGEIHILDSTGKVERVIPFDDTNRKL